MLLSRIDLEGKYISGGHTFGSAGAVRIESGSLSHRGEPFGQTVCAGEDGGPLDRKYILKTCGIGSIDPLVNRRREKVHERRTEEGEHTRIRHSWTVMLEAKRDQNIGAMTHWE